MMWGKRIQVVTHFLYSKRYEICDGFAKETFNYTNTDQICIRPAGLSI